MLNMEFTRLINNGFRITCASMALTLAGCATTQPQLPPQQMALTHGYVVAQYPVESKAKSLMLRSIANGDEFELDYDENPGGKATGLWLPPGQYEFAKWDEATVKGYPPITVEAGRVTNLGALIKVPVGSYEFVILPVTNKETQQKSTDTVEAFRSALKSAEPIEWQVTSTPKPITPVVKPTGLGLIVDLMMDYTREVNKPSNNVLLRQATNPQDFLRLAKEGSAPITDQPAMLSSGEMLFGASYGSVRVTKGNGEWSTIDTGTLANITAVTTVNNVIFIGTDDGEIKRSDDRGATWTHVTSLEAGNAVTHIANIKNTWYVISLTFSKEIIGTLSDSMSIYYGTGSQPSELKRVKEIEARLFVQFWQNFRGYSDGAAYYVNGASGVWKFSPDMQQPIEVMPPSSVSNIFASPDSSVLTAYKNQGAFSELFISQDGGTTWVERDTPPYTIDQIYFSAPDIGVATRWDMDAFSANLQIMHYVANQDTWEMDVEAPVGCRRMLRNEKMAPTYCVTDLGSILKLQDGQWKVEFASD